MNLQSYIKALKQPDDEVYAEAEAKLLAMKEGAAPILQQSLDKMVERSKMQNALSGVAMIAFVLLFLGLMSFRDTLVMCAAFLVCLVLLMSALKSTLLKSVISKNFSQSEMTIAAPRLIATAVQLEVDGNLPLLFNIVR
ncbi:MAG: hypothetical protein NT023_21895 [Armatimonadetes bacterium]|nr:hypothetical protein [Armatimonadota bacterium]